MFRCNLTGEVSKPGEKMIKLLLISRPQTYYKTLLNEETREYETVEVARGTEIVQELSLSSAGLKRWEELTDLTPTPEGFRYWNSLTNENRTQLLYGK